MKRKQKETEGKVGEGGKNNEGKRNESNLER